FPLEEIHVPIRFWHGKADANLPCSVAQKLVSRIDSAEGTWIDGEGHYSLPIHYSKEVLDWLKSGTGLK
ncbi:MAG: alpha/beta fold hydrolase, partial [Verrucomicrobiales bacterium]